MKKPTQRQSDQLKPRGFVLVTALLVMITLLSLAYFMSAFALTENKISSSQAASVQAYYLAESGVNEAIWRLKNDSAWKSNFESSATWNTTVTRSSALYKNGSYTIAIQNTAKANGTITVTSKINLGLSSAQRVIKTTVYKALGDTIIGANGEFADGNIDMSGTTLNVVGGGLFSNNNVIVNYWSTINVDGDVKAVGNVVSNLWSTIVASSTQSANNPPAPAAMTMPAISFDNSGDSDSLKARATKVYTASQFSNLLWSYRNKTLTLTGITYVTGDVDINYYNDLVINGALVADGDITLGANSLGCLLGGRSDITMSSLNTSTPSGIFSKSRIDLELCLSSLSGQGVIYANDKVNVLSLPNGITITGALVSRKLTLTSLWQGFTIIYDPDVINASVGDPAYSPVVTIDHWEEEY